MRLEANTEGLDKVLTYEPDTDLRGALFALGQMEKALRDRNDMEIRKRADYVIKRIEDEGTLERVLKGLKDEDSMIRRGAAWALGLIGGAEATELLKQATEDEDWEVRACASAALVKIQHLHAA